MFNKTIWPTASANTKVFVVVVYFVFVGIRSPLCQKDKEIFNIKINNGHSTLHYTISERA